MQRLRAFVVSVKHHFNRALQIGGGRHAQLGGHGIAALGRIAGDDERERERLAGVDAARGLEQGDGGIGWGCGAGGKHGCAQSESEWGQTHREARGRVRYPASGNAPKGTIATFSARFAAL
ncbi:hypothetical protein MMB19_02190 [Ralstonia insidiosa]|nr:hypothetical protein MMB19_02190 [Ralstonia insidiosa]